MLDAADSYPMKTLGELIDNGLLSVVNGFACGEHNGDGRGVLQVRPFNVTSSGSIDLIQQKHVPDSAAEGKPTFLRDDIVFNNTNTKELVGKAALWNGPEGCVYSNHMTRLRVLTKDISPRYLATAIHAHWLVGRSQKLARSHVAQASILGERFREIAIPWPQLPEQKIFAQAFDALQASLSVENELIEGTLLLKRAAMRVLFTRGLRGQAQKETEIGPVPESWRPRTILDLCEIWSGGTPRKSVPEYWIGSIPWVSGKDLKVPTLHDAIDHVSEAAVEAGSRLAPADAVLILVRGMGLAKDLPVALISRPMAFNQDIKALVSRGEFGGSFIRSAIYACKDRLLSRIVPSAHGTMTLNLDDVETFKVPCPSDEREAEEIAAVLDMIDRKIGLHKRKRAVLDELFKALLHKLMTGEIRVSDLDLSAIRPAASPAPVLVEA
jgi:type I restriction enzyme S subunit